MKSILFSACFALAVVGSITPAKAQGLVAPQQAPPAQVISSYQEAGIIFVDLIMASYVTGPITFQLETPAGAVLSSTTYTKSLYESAGPSIQLMMSGITTKTREHVLRLIRHGENELAAQEDFLMLLMM